MLADFKAMQSGGSETAAPPVLSVRNLRKTFGDLEVLKRASFDIYQKEVVGIIGASGSGKSTLLRCLNLLETPTDGTIDLQGERFGFRQRSEGEMTLLSASEIARQRAKTGMVFQSFNLWPHRSVLENVIEGLIIVKQIPRPEAQEIGVRLLEKVGLKDKIDSYPARLSGGQQQRVGIARALAMDPAILLLDEPTSALDPELVGEVLNVIGELAEEGMTMIIVTHEMRFAHEACDRVIFLHEGLIADDGPPSYIFGPCASERTQAFVARYVSRHAGDSMPRKSEIR